MGLPGTPVITDDTQDSWMARPSEGLLVEPSPRKRCGEHGYWRLGYVERTSPGGQAPGSTTHRFDFAWLTPPISICGRRCN